jgi:hypothetical protein
MNIWNNWTNQHDIDLTAPHHDRETKLKIYFHSQMSIAVSPSMPVTLLLIPLRVKVASSESSVNGSNWSWIHTTVQWNSSISGIVRNTTHVDIKSCLEWPILWPPRILTFPPDWVFVPKTPHPAIMLSYIFSSQWGRKAMLYHCRIRHKTIKDLFCLSSNLFQLKTGISTSTISLQNIQKLKHW